MIVMMVILALAFLLLLLIVLLLLLLLLPPGMRETFATDALVKDIRAPVFSALLTYIYTDTLQLEKPEDIMELLVVANQVQTDLPLAARCSLLCCCATIFTVAGSCASLKIYELQLQNTVDLSSKGIRQLYVL